MTREMSKTKNIAACVLRNSPHGEIVPRTIEKWKSYTGSKCNFDQLWNHAKNVAVPRLQAEASAGELANEALTDHLLEARGNGWTGLGGLSINQSFEQKRQNIRFESVECRRISNQNSLLFTYHSAVHKINCASDSKNIWNAFLPWTLSCNTKTKTHASKRVRHVHEYARVCKNTQSDAYHTW